MLLKLLTFLFLCIAAIDPAYAWNHGGGGSAAPPPPAATVSQTELVVDRIYQRVGTAKTITFAGTYTGSPDAVDIEIVDASSGSALVGWTTLDPAPAAGAFTGTLSVPQYDGWMKWKARVHSIGNSSAVTSTNQFGVGALIMMSGQSNMEQYWGDISGSPPTANANTRRYAGNGWFPVSDSDHTGEISGAGTVGHGGDGSIVFANAMHQTLGVSVGVLEYAVGSTTSADWAQGGSKYNQMKGPGGSAPFGFTYGDVGSDFELDVHAQGEDDANGHVSGSTYTTNVGSFYSGIKTATGRSTLPMGFQPLGRSTIDGANATYWTSIRNAQLAFIAAQAPYVYYSAEMDDCDILNTSGRHCVNAWYQHMANRHAQSYGKYLGIYAQDGTGPVITAAHWGGSGAASLITLTIATRNSATLQDGAGNAAGTSLQGFEVFDNGVQVFTKTTSATLSGNNVLITTSSPLSSADVTGNLVTVDFGATNDPFPGNVTIASGAGGRARVLYMTGAPMGDSVFAPLMPTNGSVTVQP